MSLVDKEKQLEQMVAEINQIDKKRAELYDQVRKLDYEINHERMVSVEANPLNVLLYGRRHWERSGEAYKRYINFFQSLKVVQPKWDQNGKLIIQYLPSSRVESETHIKEVESFLPHLSYTSFPYIESCKGDVLDLNGRSFLINLGLEYSSYFVIDIKGQGFILEKYQSSFGSIRLREKTRSEDWKTLIPWMIHKFGGGSEG